MIRVVFDTNTVVSAAFSDTTISNVAFKKAIEKCQILVSESSINELKEVLFRSKFDKYLSFEKRQNFLIRYLAIAEFIETKSVITDCRDSKDNKFLELGIDGKANVIVTGDNDLLILNPYKNIEILSSSKFIEWLEE